MNGGGRILVLGGHEFNRRSGNDAIVELITELADSSRPRICLLPTASGDPEDQIGSFRRSFSERDCHPSSISLFRLGVDRVDVREHLLSQDVIYAGGGSMVNLIAIWRAHGLDSILSECWEEGILICGQSAGAMCWFEQAITCSSGEPATAGGLGLLPGSACVHYLSVPQRRACFLRAIGSGRIPAGFGLEDQTGALFEGRRLAETIVARERSAVWRVERVAHGMGVGDSGAAETPLDSRRVVDQRPAIDARSSEILEFRETLAARTASRGSRRGVGRLD
ncbi:MAG: peptidase E [Actinomycetota bacterium]|nr:peptidase E [Actinomycetota bacterium]